jgi:transformation/transcription domain-associated protein
MSEVDIIRGHTSCLRRIVIRGHDGSTHPFILQHPAPRHCRKEERLVQFCRILNTILVRKKESRRRNLSIHVPVIIPLAPQIRLVQDDTSYASLQEIFEKHCKENGISRDDPANYYVERIRSVFASSEGQPKSVYIFF